LSIQFHPNFVGRRNLFHGIRGLCMGAHTDAAILMGAMKTTIGIADPLLREARRPAAREGLTLRAMVERGLHNVIAEARTGAHFTLSRASFKGKGLRPDLRDLAYEDRGARA
jgi:hypothetical protein